MNALDIIECFKTLTRDLGLNLRSRISSKKEITMKSRHKFAAILYVVVMLAFAACSKKDPATNQRLAPLLEGMGELQHAVTTKNEMAQRFFNQGLTLAYAFNHKEAERSFREAARLDPYCAMAYWGIALVLGPNINAAMDNTEVPNAHAAIQKALALAPKASEKEQAYINTLSKRYTNEAVADRKPLDEAYANAMREVARRYPDDSDAAALFAEALMDLHPWKYWEKNGQPKPWTPEIVSTIETGLQNWPKHPGLNHFYIHAVEASASPERGMASADLLGELAPSAGHLVHMPSHIYIRTGRYHDAVLANERAIEADSSYITQCHAQGMYPVTYVPHNHHFLSAAAIFGGNSEKALIAAHHMAMNQDQKLMCQPGFGTL
jgi:tetratricopeptide (TPR) repeat protein